MTTHPCSAADAQRVAQLGVHAIATISPGAIVSSPTTCAGSRGTERRPFGPSRGAASTTGLERSIRRGTRNEADYDRAGAAQDSGTAASDYSIRSPLIARAITSCWICSVPSKMS
jgi:hypothetical protein